MNYKSRLIALALLALVLCALVVSPLPVVAQTGKISVAEFRVKFTAYIIWQESNTVSSQSLAMKVQAMSNEEFQAFYDSFADPDAFIAFTEQIMAPPPQLQSMYTPEFGMPFNSQPLVVLPEPDYPSATAWLTYVPSIFGPLGPVPQDSNWAYEGCPANTESNLAITADYLAAATIVADTSCTSIPSPANVPFCIAAGVAHEAELWANIQVNKCSSIGDDVDSAENEATYEIAKIISGQVSTHDAEIKDILATNHAEVMDTLAKNQAQLLRIEIEKELSVASDNKRLSYFYLPQAQGGLLELVRQTVLDTITANQSAGISIGNAQSWFNKAEASLAKGSYKTAYDLYKKAYFEAVK